MKCTRKRSTVLLRAARNVLDRIALTNCRTGETCSVLAFLTLAIDDRKFSRANP